jgi:2-(1,2-epoxy-1,2-dihydrophenyl)acetyl-CoA isomerase
MSRKNNDIEGLYQLRYKCLLVACCIPLASPQGLLRDGSGNFYRSRLIFPDRIEVAIEGSGFKRPSKCARQTQWTYPSLKLRRLNMDEFVKLEVMDGIARVTLSRPRFFNAFDLEMIQSLAERLIDLSMDRHVVGVVITGSGKAFCAGGDLGWVSGYGKTYGEAFHALAARYHQAILEIRRMPKPVVAAINGLAAGGGFSMALACDFRVMEAAALLRQGYTSNGLSIDGGGTFALPRLVGLSRAMEIAAFDRPISAEQALGWGLVTEVVEDGQALQRAVEVIEELKGRSHSSFAVCKRLINDSFDNSFEGQMEREREALSWCADHPNGQEGIKAFLEKRKPLYNV